MAGHKEGKIENYLAAQVTKAGGFQRKVQWIARRGCPDRFIAFPRGRHGFVEVKAPDEAPEAHQEREMKRLRDADVTVAVVSTFAEVDALVQVWSTPR